MDKLPRLRQKPKPPAIETSLRLPSRDAAEPAASLSLAAAPLSSSPLPPLVLQQQPQQYQQLQSLDKPSSFCSLKICSSTKRARVASPAGNFSSSPVVTVFHQDTPSRAPSPQRRHDLTARRPARSVMPDFLMLSAQEMDRKFQEITWAERLRDSEAACNQAVDNYRWGQFQQVDFHHRGPMDRYNNIRPWNHNRVRLHVPEGEFDYVNASAIVLSSPSNPRLPPLRYIAMQGPTPPSFDYVWRMVAENIPSPAVIVQLTTMHENGVLKCHQYFPSSRDDSTWTLNQADVWHDGWSAQLTYVSRSEWVDGAIEICKLLLDVDGEDCTRVVWHLLYRRWPDFGVPSLHDMTSFLDLMRLSRDYSAGCGPRIVHCSAGVGRTGTFICLEHMIRELHSGAFDRAHCEAAAKSPDPVFDAVELLRQQRRGMVQSEPQYHFIYHVVRKLWQERHGISDRDADGEPAPKRLEIADPFTDDGHHHRHGNRHYQHLPRNNNKPQTSTS